MAPANRWRLSRTPSRTGGLMGDSQDICGDRWAHGSPLSVTGGVHRGGGYPIISVAPSKFPRPNGLKFLCPRIGQAVCFDLSADVCS